MSNDFDPYYKWLGIAPKDQPPNYYRLLGIEPFESDAEVIAGAGNQRFIYVQSFQSGRHAALSQRILEEIKTAGFCLLDKKRKAEYDNILKSQLDGLQQVPKVPKNSQAGHAADSQSMPVDFVEEVKISKFVKTNGVKHGNQIWPVIISVLSLAVIIVIVLAIQRNIYDISATISGNKPVAKQLTDRIDETKVKAENKDTAKENKKEDSSKNSRSTKNKEKEAPKKDSDSEKKEITDNNKSESEEKQDNDTSKSDEGTGRDEEKSETEKGKFDESLRQKPKDKLIPLAEAPFKKKFDPDIYETRIDEIINQLNDSMNQEQTQLIIVHYNDGRKVLATYILDRNKMPVLEGLCAAFAKNGQPVAIANYNSGLLHGVLKTWNDKGKRIFWCEYIGGVRNGFCCCYKDDRFSLLMEIYDDKIKSVNLVKDGSLEKSTDSVKQAEKDPKINDIFMEARYQVFNLSNRDKKAFKSQFITEYANVYNDVSILMKTKGKGQSAVQSHIGEYKSECKKLIDSLRKYDSLKKSVW